MKNNFVIIFIILAVISMAFGLLDKLMQAKLIFRSFTWHELAQTFLLFGIAWGIWQGFRKEVK